MPTCVTTPTAYLEVNAVLNELLSGVQTILRNQFIGMYLYGSLAGGDFNPQTSDIDFLVVTASRLPGEMIAALQAMHARMAASGSKWAAKLEGAYVPQHALRRYDPSAEPCPTLNEGRFYLDRQGSDWVIQRHVLREHGVVMAGPAPYTLIDPVPSDELRRAVLGILHGWWAPTIDDPARWHSAGYQAYAVLSMCRALHALQHGTIVSKPVAARWAAARQATGEQRAALIERALAWRPDSPMEDLDETLDFIRYTLESSRQFDTRAPSDEV